MNDKPDYTPQWRLEALKIASVMFLNNDGSNGTANANEFLEYVNKFSEYILYGTLNNEKEPPLEAKEDQGESVLGFTKENDNG